MSQTYGINSTTKQKLVNLNYWINKFVINITKKITCIKMLEIVCDPTTTIALKFIDLQCNLVISYVKLVIEILGSNGLLSRT